MRSPALRRLPIACVVVCALGAALVASALGSDRRAQVNVTSDTTATTTPTTGPGRRPAPALRVRTARHPARAERDRHEQVPDPAARGSTAGSSGSSPTCGSPNGTVPPVDVIHLHHGVWANAHAPRRHRAAVPRALPRRRRGEDRAAAPAGLRLPRTAPTDCWWLNYMIHNLTPKPFKVSITYDVDFVPATSPPPSGMKDVHPIWMDVQNGSIYPVFDVLKGSGHRRAVHLPRRARPVRAAAPKNEWTRADRRRARAHVRPPAPRRSARRRSIGDCVTGRARTCSRRRRSTTSPRARCRGTCR